MISNEEGLCCLSTKLLTYSVDKQFKTSETVNV